MKKEFIKHNKKCYFISVPKKKKNKKKTRKSSQPRTFPFHLYLKAKNPYFHLPFFIQHQNNKTVDKTNDI